MSSKTPETAADGEGDETPNYPQLNDEVIDNLSNVSVNYEQINYNL